MLEELALLKDVFLSNGYPEKLVLKTLEDSWPKETLKAVLKGVEQKVKVEKPKDSYFEVLHAPYVRGFSEGLQRRLRTSSWVCSKEWRDNIFQCVQVETKN